MAKLLTLTVSLILPLLVVCLPDIPVVSTIPPPMIITENAGTNVFDHYWTSVTGWNMTWQGTGAVFIKNVSFNLISLFSIRGPL